MNSSRILSRFFKQTWRGYSAGKGMYQPAGRPQSATARYFEYLQSPAGKKAFEILIPGVSLATALCLVLGDWVFAYSYINVFETLKDESERKAAFKLPSEDRPNRSSEKMASLLAEVVKDMKLRSASARKIHLFPSNSPCPLSLGLAESLFSDAWIGYPFFMDWASPEDVKLEGAVLKTYWNPLSAKGFDFKSGVSLSSEEKESFLFSEAACKFSLGKAYLDASPDRIYKRILLPIIGINAAHIVIRKIKSRYSSMFVSFPLRFALNSIIISSFLSASILILVMDTLEREYSNIQTLCSLSEDYQRGGLEFYTKLKALQSFLYRSIQYGDFYFTEDGEMTKSWYELTDEKFASLLGKGSYITRFSEIGEKNVIEVFFSGE